MNTEGIRAARLLEEAVKLLLESKLLLEEVRVLLAKEKDPK